MTDNLDAALAELDALDIDEFAEHEAAKTKNPAADMTFFRDVPLTITLEVASTELTLGELSKVRDGDVLPLDKVAGEPLDVMVNGVAFAKAEVVMVDGHYGIRFLPQQLSDETVTDA
ncbi:MULTISPECIES: FliM/FliN family flagellar motor switch protein [Shewanella]|jgi:flagellar motor switch protein FliN/FliY|uniref:FliM/FliN family flagellar motor switch protein n=1 Tax=Shewanella TaxID=22 RepID=UPI00167296CE|nr:MULTISPECIES: FliM/FliN family flagellar motor switch protein [Shewanella]MBO1272163.1 FliM/FliN family flagellar motor switch protein [Shewanella sp. 4t3-1-2LB]MCL2908021.1 FliM/FliN family flagellar motor switch protein [Shewanella fodinae]GGZ12634.1 flagellar motor switch protein FliN [Shewanella fodinae]